MYVQCAREPGSVSMETGSRRRDGHTSNKGKKACARLSESSESSDSFSEYLFIFYNNIYLPVD